MRKLILAMSVVGAFGFMGCTPQGGQTDVDAPGTTGETTTEGTQDPQAQTGAPAMGEEAGERAPAATGEVDCMQLQEGGISPEEQALWEQHCANQ